VYGTGDNYALLNSGSSYVYFENFTYEEQNNNITKKKGYTARNGNHIYFNHVNLYGIDDHWGYHYYVDNSKIVGEGIGFAGKSFDIRRSTISSTGIGFMVRTDTPFVEGILNIEDVTFDNVGKNIGYLARQDPDNRMPGIALKFFDEIRIKNVNVMNSFTEGENINDKAFIKFSTDGTGWSQEVNVTIGDIIFENVTSDKKLLDFSTAIPCIVDRITYKKCKFIPTISETGLNGAGILSYGKQQINEIILDDCYDLSFKINNVGGVNVIPHIIVNNSKIKKRGWEVASDTIVEFKDCEISDAYLNLNKVIIKDNLFKLPFSYTFLRPSTVLLYSEANIAEVGISTSRLPALDDYVDNAYYISTVV